MSSDRKQCKLHPTQEYRFFVFDPNGEGLEFYPTIEDRDRAAAEIIELWKGDGWNEGVTQIIAGEATHHTVARNVELPPRRTDFESDEEFEDAQVEFGDWQDWDFKCGYELAPLSDPGESTTELRRSEADSED